MNGINGKDGSYGWEWELWELWENWEGMKTPAAAMAIPACGVGHFRVRRWASPQAAFFGVAGGLITRRLTG